jgi:hypothetical protein
MKTKAPQILLDYIEEQNSKLFHGEDYVQTILYHEIHFNIAWEEGDGPTVLIRKLIPVIGAPPFTLDRISAIDIICDSPIAKAWDDRIKDFMKLVKRTEEEYDFVLDF